VQGSDFVSQAVELATRELLAVATPGQGYLAFFLFLLIILIMLNFNFGS